MIYAGNHNTHGRLGNQVMRLMGLMGLADLLECEYAIPEWPYAKYFETPINQKNLNRFNVLAKEKDFHYTPEYWLPYKEMAKDKVVNLSAWLQSPKYWGRNKLKFKESFLSELRQKYATLFEKPVIAVSIRRGDFVGNPNYHQIPINYYLYNLPKGMTGEAVNLAIFSDDLDYCRVHFSCLPNAYLIEASDIEQLALMTLCDSYIISNSTFSYVGAYLSQNPDPLVLRPQLNFAGPLAQRHQEKDFWPEGWQTLQNEQSKLPLRDVTFTIPVSYDHPDRRQNLELSVCLLQKAFDTNIILMEQGGSHFKYMGKYVQYEQFEGDSFHRTRMLNDMARMAGTPIVVNWDADVCVPPLQIFSAVEAIRKGADMVYPYDGRFARVPRLEWFKKLERHLDVGIFGKTEFKGMKPMDRISYGGAVLFNRESFISGGMENENMISYAPEDFERYERFTKLGYRVERVRGVLYHLDHFKGVNSSHRLNPFFSDNKREYDKVREMTPEQLREYVSAWHLNRRPGEYIIPPHLVERALENLQALKNYKNL